MTAAARDSRRGSAPSWTTPVLLGAAALTALAVALALPRPGSTGFRLSTAADLVQLPDVVLPAAPASIALAVALLALAAASAAITWRGRRTPRALLVAYAAVAVVAGLVWAAAGGTIPVPGLLVGALSLSIPIVFGALGGVLSERTGVVNVAIEGQLLAGAFTAAVISSITQQPVAGLLGAMLAGALVGAVLAVFSIRYAVDQVIVGVVLNVLVIGITSFVFTTVLAPEGGVFNSPAMFERVPLPVLSGIPVLGPLLFRQTAIGYLMLIAVAVVWYALIQTRWGLRLRAIGEHPMAADTVGIDVNRRRFWNVALAGLVTGVGGAYFTLASVGSFNREMTAGAGFIALAAVIFGRWDPVRAALAALLFGFASNLQNVLGVVGSPVPSEFLLMLPYLVTIVAVTGLAGRVRAPAAAGSPYTKP